MLGVLVLLGGLGMAAPPTTPDGGRPPEREGEGPAAPTGSRGPQLDPDTPLVAPAGAPALPEPPTAKPVDPPAVPEAPAAAPAAPAPLAAGAEPGPAAAIRPDAVAPARTVTVRLIFPGAPQGVTLVDSAGGRHRILPNTPVTLPLGELQILPHAGPGGARVLLTETSRILSCASADMCVVK